MSPDSGSRIAELERQNLALHIEVHAALDSTAPLRQRVIELEIDLAASREETATALRIIRRLKDAPLMQRIIGLELASKASKEALGGLRRQDPEVGH